jgi:hypothetical protein
MLKRELLKLLEDVPDDAPISIINEYDEIETTGYDILEVITTKGVNYDICKNDFGENEKRKSAVTYVYLLKEV